MLALEPVSTPARATTATTTEGADEDADDGAGGDPCCPAALWSSSFNGEDYGAAGVEGKARRQSRVLAMNAQS